jgi:hypothetical protein
VRILAGCGWFFLVGCCEGFDLRAVVVVVLKMVVGYW